MVQKRAMATLKLLCYQRGDLQGGTAAARLATAERQTTGMHNCLQVTQTRQTHTGDGLAVLDTDRTRYDVSLMSEVHVDQQKQLQLRLNFREW
jgi:hypothetical protein